MTLLGPKKDPKIGNFFTFFKYRHVTSLLKANQMYITNLHFILQNKVKVDNVHWLSFPKRYHKPIFQKGHKMTYLGVFWDLNGSFGVLKWIFCKNKVKVDNVY